MTEITSLTFFIRELRDQIESLEAVKDKLQLLIDDLTDRKSNAEERLEVAISLIAKDET